MVSWVLKEWQVAVTALLQGETILLLRKGGIREAKGQFALAARQVLLLPTTEHQKAALLKDAFRPLITEEVAHDDQVRFDGWATITHALPLSAEAEVVALLPYLVWNEQFVAERLNWQPDRPLYGLLLRAYRLDASLVLPRHAGYNGCRSWVEIGESVAVGNSIPAMAETDYTDQVNAILAALPTVMPIVP
ncbi:DUF1802 family protein [Phormidium tenue]|uniref:DUF1802 domain-containing protein n=1 Tax=Phormidium tenue NIES-30 TaxID=549789 RepID=A0A1U7JA49_9CYAN|nr:DUF1802 family protein [Phormidium tenue]MBD2230673.1 DUF1802 family protein [Phormidium tenue FACHB-1052]OKH50570.1 hypothetical protein NIES30_00205 [Phormidium tenue NIES-30]